MVMSTLGKLVLGAMGALRARPALGDGPRTLALPPASLGNDITLQRALSQRRSSRVFDPRALPLPLPLLSNLLWAADGINRDSGHRTAPSALDERAIDLIVTLPEGAYRYDAPAHALQRVADEDLRRLTGYQDFVDAAPLNIVYVVDHARMGRVPASQRTLFAAVAAGAIAQNVYLYAAGAGLATVLRGWLDRESLANALGLQPDQEVLMAQTVGFHAA
jgi:nitroreductase